ncbi:MAG TPA: SEL1-like repeat protein, partial [Candidatus Akkermansia intestinigallinarum]|nr:SEL1-like repeat protein [Candidatus Akkermansia intestinigallinarum]
VAAMNCFLRAAQLNNRAAQYNLGRCYFHGLGTPKDEQAARFWISKAAEAGHADARAFMQDHHWGAVL